MTPYRRELLRIDDRLAEGDRLLSQTQSAIDSGAFGAAADFALQAASKLAAFLKDNEGLVFGRQRAGVADANAMIDELTELRPILALRADLEAMAA